MNLFNISGYTGTITYSKYDSVYVSITGGLHYYYSLEDNNASHPTGNNNKWTRFPLLYFLPNYTTTASLVNQFTSIQFGDGYKQRAKNNLDTQKLNFSLKYNNVSTKKATCILNFLQNTQSVEPFIFNDNSIFKNGNSFVCDSPKITYNNYNSYNIDVNLFKLYELGNYYDTVKIDVKSNNPIYFFSGLSIEPGTYRIQYKEGAPHYGNSIWFETNYLTIYYNDNDDQYDFYITGNGTGTNSSWSTESLAQIGIRKVNPYTIITHTGGRIGISFNDTVYSDNNTGNPPYSFALYKIAK